MFVSNFILFNVFVLLHAEHPKKGGGNTNESIITGELSKQKCKEYSQHAPNKSECESLREDLSYLRGHFALDKEYPHMVVLGYRVDGQIQWSCGGALISEQFVLTVAHCIISRLGNPPEVVRVGVANLNDTEHSQDIKIQEMSVHPDFKPISFYNDIALVKLEKKLHFNNNVLPACLYTQKEVDSPRAINSGWGTTEFGGDHDSRLQEELLYFHNQSMCNETYKRSIGRKLENGIVSETMVCAGSKWSNTHTMIKSGGALQIYNKEYECMFDIIGMASFGKGFDSKIPSVFTRISGYLPWIEEKVWK